MSPEYMFRQLTSGLHVPVGLRIDGSQFRQTTPPEPSQVESPRELSGVSVVPEYDDLWTGPLPVLADLLSSVPLEWWFEVVSRLGAALLNEAATNQQKLELSKSFFLGSARHNLETFLATIPHGQVFEPFSILLTIELAAVYSSRAATPVSLDDASAIRVVQGICLVSHLINENMQGAVSADPAGVAAALTERGRLGGPFRNLQTAWGLWLWNHSALSARSKQSREIFSASLRAEYGLSLQEWIIATSCVALRLAVHSLDQNMRGRVSFALPLTDLTSEGNRLVSRALKAMSESVEGFQTRCRDLHEASSLIAQPSLLPIKQFPAIELSSDPPAYSIISATHVSEAAIERPVRLRETPSLQARNAARQDFGEVFESYVDGILRDTFQDRYQRVDHNRFSRAEGVIWYPHGAIVVECKARRVPEKSRYIRRTDQEYETELRRIDLPKALSQIKETRDDIINGKIRTPTGVRIRVLGSLVVCYQDLPASIIASSVMKRFIGDNQRDSDVLLLKPQIVPIDMIEDLDRWAFIDLLDQLVRKMADDVTSYEPLRNYLIANRMLPRDGVTRRTLSRAVVELVRPFFVR